MDYKGNDYFMDSMDSMSYGDSINSMNYRNNYSRINKDLISLPKGGIEYMGVENTNLVYDLIVQRNKNNYTVEAYFDVSSIDNIYKYVVNPYYYKKYDKIIYTNCIDPNGKSSIVHINFVPILY